MNSGLCLKGLTGCFLEDVVGGFGPDEGVGAVVPAGGELAGGGDELAGVAEDAAVNGLAFDDGEPDFDEVEP